MVKASAPYFIAEVSSNHSVDINRCYEFIDRAAAIGCNSIKFQLFKIDKLFHSSVIRVRKDIRARREWELPLKFLPLLAVHCEKREIEFSCTPFYLEAVDELKPYVKYYKIASYTLLWDDFLIKCAQAGKPVILSTGMATLEEIEHAVSVLEQNGCHEISLLHCVSAYPTPLCESNLSAIEVLRNRFKYRVGLSDHSVEPGVLQRAIHHWGAEIIEFHFDLEGRGPEYEAGHCWLPEQIAPVIKQVTDGFKADGCGIKKPAQSELIERMWRTDPWDGLRPLRLTRKKSLLHD